MPARTLRLTVKCDAPKASKMIEQAIKRAEQIPEDERVGFCMAAFAAIVQDCVTFEGVLPTGDG